MATWRPLNDGLLFHGWLLEPSRALTYLRINPDGRATPYGSLPKPLSDDGDAYRMAEQEQVWVNPTDSTCRVWRGRWWVPMTTGHYIAGTDPHPSRKIATCLAVCAKYADHPELGPIAKHLIPRLEGTPAEKKTK